ncbi:MAG: MFS transporter [Rubrivivax sp.]|nr:MFS transporter [Rubrivivax sp.]
MSTADLHPATTAATTATPAAPARDRYRTYVLAALAVVGFMCAVDRVVISMFMEPIKKEFALSDTQLGLLTGVAFSIMGGLASVPLARWADRGNRKWIIGGSLAAWSLMTAASGVASNFVQLLAARMGVGIGEAGCIPATHSMLGDYYPRDLRPRALGIHSAGTYLGALGGMLGGGILLQTVGWRAGFVWLGVAGVVMAVIFHLTVREPARTLSAPAPASPASAGTQPPVRLIDQLGDLRAFGWLVVAFSTTSLAGSAVMVWLPSYFGRAFTLTPLQIGLGLGLCIGVATAIGSIAGGQLAVRYAKHSRSWGTAYAAGVTVLVMPFYVGSFHAPHPLLAFVMLFCAFLIAGSILGPVFSTLQDMVAPEARATAFAVVALFGMLVGQGLGPLLVGAISDTLHVQQGAAADGLRWAMTWVALVNLFTIVAFWRLSRRIADTPAPR